MTSPNESDVLIIGGGIAGTATAFHLAQYGKQVTLLERGRIAGEASGINAGGLGGAGWSHNPGLQSYLTAGSFEIFKTLQLDMGYDIEFHAPGGLQAVHTAQQWDYIRDQVLRLKADGYNVELLTIREARSIEPEASESLAGFMFFKDRQKFTVRTGTVFERDCPQGCQQPPTIQGTWHHPKVHLVHASPLAGSLPGSCSVAGTTLPRLRWLSAKLQHCWGRPSRPVMRSKGSLSSKTGLGRLRPAMENSGPTPWSWRREPGPGLWAAC